MSGGAVAPYAFRWPTIRSRSTLPETARYDGVEEVLERNIRWAASKSTRNLFRRKSNARRAVVFKSFGPDNNMQLYIAESVDGSRPARCALAGNAGPALWRGNRHGRRSLCPSGIASRT